MNLNTKQFKRFLPILNFIIFIIIFLFLSLPQFQGFRKLRDIRTDQEKTLADKQRILGVIKSLDRSKISKLEFLMPRIAKEPELLVQSERLATESGLSLGSIDLSVDENLGQVSINQKLSGSYQNFKVFLDNLEKNLRLMDVESISLSRDDESGTLGFNLEVRAYFEGQQESPSEDLNMMDL